MEAPNEQIEKVTTRSTGIRYGLFLAAFSIVSFLVTTLSGMNITSGSGAWVNRIISIAATLVVFYMAHDYFKKNGDGYMSFGQGFGIGFWASLTSSVVASVFTYIYVKFVDATFMDMIRDKAISDMEAKGMSQEQIDQAMKVASMFMSAEAILIFGLLAGLFFGALLAIIVTIFTQKKNPEATLN